MVGVLTEELVMEEGFGLRVAGGRTGISGWEPYGGRFQIIVSCLGQVMSSL